MIRIERAFFGNKDGAHSLLLATCADVPSALFGKTDSPPGLLNDLATWSPFIGCGLVGEWWAVWKGKVDQTASRGGMVKTQSLLVPKEEIGRISDLRPLFDALCEENVQEPLFLDPGALLTPTQQPAGFRSLIHQLLHKDFPKDFPIVIPGVELLEPLVEALWTRLWPSARQTFSACVAFDPDHTEGKWLVATPREFVSRWRTDAFVDVRDEKLELKTPAEKWFVRSHRKESDDPFQLAENEFQLAVDDIDDLGTDCCLLKKLDRVFSLATRLQEQDCAVSISLLRQLSYLPKSRGVISKIRSKALESVFLCLQVKYPKAVTMLANVPTTGLDEEQIAQLKNIVTTKTQEQFPLLLPGEVEKLCAGLGKQPEIWWYDSVRAGIMDWFCSPTVQKAKFVFNVWRICPLIDFGAEFFLPNPRGWEESLLSIPVNVGEHASARLLTLCERLDWSALYGAVLSQTFSPSEAIQKMRQFTGDPVPGLLQVYERIEPTILLPAVLASGWELALVQIAQLTIRGKCSLSEIDPRKDEWLLVWQSHTELGGEPWQGIPNIPVVFGELMDVVCSGKKIDVNFIERLCKHREATLLLLNHRSTIWAQLPENVRSIVVNATADAWIHRWIYVGITDEPEYPLKESILHRIARSMPQKIHPKTVVSIFAALPDLPEDDFLDWIDRFHEPVNSSDGQKIGQFLCQQQWERSAKKLYEQRWKRKDLDNILRFCSSLLPTWKRWSIPKAPLDGEAFLHESPSSQPITVFLSYSHDSDEHAAKVKQLADTLRQRGVHAQLDQYTMPQGPPEGWPRWMERNIQDATFVVCVCSPTYRRRIEGKEEYWKGKGVAWEGNILYNLLYRSKGEGKSIIPVLFDDEPDDSIPLVISGLHFHRLPDGFEALYRHITNQPGFVMPATAEQIVTLPTTGQPSLPPGWQNLGRSVLHLSSDDIAMVAQNSSSSTQPNKDAKVSGNKYAALEKLLRDCFTAEELRVWLNRHYQELSGALPGNAVSLSELISAVVGSLERRNLVDQQFFGLLRSERPRREQDIRAVEALWHHNRRH